MRCALARLACLLSTSTAMLLRPISPHDSHCVLQAGMPIGYQPSAVGAARQALINQGLVAAPMQLHKPEENKAAYVAELEINDFPQQARFKVRGLRRHTWG